MTYEEWLDNVELFLGEAGYFFNEINRFMDTNSTSLFEYYQAGFGVEFAARSLM